MTTKSREYLYGSSIKAAAEAAAKARKEADSLACDAWNKGLQGAGPAPTLGGALNGGYGYLEVSVTVATLTRP